MTQSPAAIPTPIIAPPTPALASSTTSLWRPAQTLWRREMVRFFRQRNRVMSALVTPILMWLMLGMGLNRSFIAPSSAPAPGADGGIGYMEYFFPGTVTMILLFTAIFSTITVIEDRREGFLQGVLVSPAPRLAIVLGKVLGGASIALIHAFVFLLIWPFAGASFNFWLLLAAIPLLILLAVGMTALGFCIAWPMDSTAGFHAVMMVFLMPMWFLSGAIFPVDTAPLGLKIIMLANPLTYAHEAFAYTLTGGRATTGVPIHLAFSIIITVGFCAGITALAAWLVNKPRKDGQA